MTRPSINRIIVAVSVIGLPLLLTAHKWGPLIDGQLPDPAPRHVPFQEAMRCPEWQPGLSRTLVVMALEDELGIVTGLRCIRTQERGKVRTM